MKLVIEPAQLLDKIYDQKDTLVFVFDRDLNFLYINQALKKYIWEKYSVSASVGDNINDLFSADIIANYLPTLDKLFETGKPQTLTVKYISEKGSLIAHEIEFIPLSDDRHSESYIGLLKDVTEQQEIEFQLQSHFNLHRFIFENTIDILMIHEPNGNIMDVSSSVTTSLGYEEKELIGQSPYNFFHQDDIPYISETHKNALDGKSVKVTYRFRHKNGTFVWLETVTSVLKNNQGEIIQIYTNSRKISDRLDEEKANLILMQNKLRSFQDQLIEAHKIAKIASWQYDFKKDRFILSDEAINLLNLSPKKAYRTGDIKNLIPKEEWKYVKKQFEQIKSQKETTYEHRILSNKKAIWIKVHLKPLLDKNGNITRISGIAQDITKSKLMDLELQEKTKIFEEAQRIAKLCSVVIHFKKNSVTTSEEFKKITGIDKTHFSNEEFINIIHPKDKEKVGILFREKMKKKELFETEYRILHQKNKRIVHIHSLGSFEYSPNGEVNRYIGTLQDITDLKKAESNLRRYNNHLNAILENINGAVFNIQGDDLYGFTFLSPSILNITGYKRDEIMPFGNLDFAQLIHSNDLHHIDKARSGALKNNGKYELTYRINCKDETIKWVWESANCSYSEDNIPEIDGVMIDISHRIKMEERIMFATISAEEKERKRISSEIHDGLQQMILSAKLNVDSVRNKKNNIDLELLERLHKSSAILEDAIEESRAISRKLMPKKIEEEGYISATKNLISSLNIEGIQFYTNIESDRYPVLLELSLYRITQEALSNVIKYAKANEVYVQLIKTNNSLNLSIEDDGCGFDLQTIEEKTSSIGLSSMKSRATAVGGRFEIDSRPENGTYIMVEIPFNSLIFNGHR